MEDPSFAELVVRAGRGDTEASRWLVERYESAIRRQVRFSLMDNKLRRVLEVTDVCQSVMGQFFSGLGAGRFALDAPEQLLGLLKQMVRNKITDEARYWRAERRDYLRNVVPNEETNPVEPASADPTPSRVVEESEFLAAFESRLSGWERTVFEYRRQGMGWPEIAARTGDGSEAIRKRFERALDRVGRTLKVIA
jgi:DNA-directed RNA polymerase specialized sigma24 family protein